MEPSQDELSKRALPFSKRTASAALGFWGQKKMKPQKSTALKLSSNINWFSASLLQAFGSDW